jgi:hypothetical protein
VRSDSIQVNASNRTSSEPYSVMLLRAAAWFTAGEFALVKFSPRPTRQPFVANNLADLGVGTKVAQRNLLCVSVEVCFRDYEQDPVPCSAGFDHYELRLDQPRPGTDSFE